jgi:hypothetical protein
LRVGGAAVLGSRQQKRAGTLWMPALCLFS